jgi:hypothetical protein
VVVAGRREDEGSKTIELIRGSAVLPAFAVGSTGQGRDEFDRNQYIRFVDECNSLDRGRTRLASAVRRQNSSQQPRVGVETAVAVS